MVFFFRIGSGPNHDLRPDSLGEGHRSKITPFLDNDPMPIKLFIIWTLGGNPILYYVCLVRISQRSFPVRYDPVSSTRGMISLYMHFWIAHGVYPGSSKGGALLITTYCIGVRMPEGGGDPAFSKVARI